MAFWAIVRTKFLVYRREIPSGSYALWCGKYVTYSCISQTQQQKWAWRGGAWEAGEATNWSQVQCLILTTLRVASTEVPSHCQLVEPNILTIYTLHKHKSQQAMTLKLKRMPVKRPTRPYDAISWWEKQLARTISSLTLPKFHVAM